MEAGLNVITLPKTIDNDIAGTDTSFGFATATEIATEAIDRVHSTAHSHHRIILVEVMGDTAAGWLSAPGAWRGADVILIPEIPYDVEKVARRSRRARARQPVQRRRGRRGRDAQAAGDALPKATTPRQVMGRSTPSAPGPARPGEDRACRDQGGRPRQPDARRSPTSSRADRARGPGDDPRLPAARRDALCRRSACLPPGWARRRAAGDEGVYGVMVAAAVQGLGVGAAGRRGRPAQYAVLLDHPWLRTARDMGVSLGDA